LLRSKPWLVERQWLRPIEAVGQAAELVSPDNVFDIERGMREVLLNCERRESLKLAGRAQAKRFHWESTAQQVLAIYREVATK